AELAFSVEGDELGEVRCDGLVASTPAGSTGYNLANGGPILAWGVEGFVVSFIAPHTLTARALVVATDAVLAVRNNSDNEPVDVTTTAASSAGSTPRWRCRSASSTTRCCWLRSRARATTTACVRSSGACRTESQVLRFGTVSARRLRRTPLVHRHA